MPARRRRRPERLSREEWLEAALEVLAREGEGRIRVRQLAAALGVTTGSFYAHFRDRSDFLTQILEYWNAEYTEGLAAAVASHPGPPRETLHWLARQVLARGAAQFDIPVRAWATHEPGAAEMVQASDRTRLRSVGRLFRALGFRGRELAMRTDVYVTYMSSQAPFTRGKSTAAQLAEIDAMIELLCRDAAKG